MPIDISDLTLIEEENNPNRPQAQVQQEAIDLSDLTPIEEPQENMFYLEDKDKVVSLPAELDDQQANEEIQVQEYGKDRNGFFGGLDIMALPKATAQMAIMLGKVAPIYAEEEAVLAQSGLEAKQQRLADKIIEQGELRAKIKANDPNLNFFQEFIQDAVNLTKLEPIFPMKNDLVDVSMRLNTAKSIEKTSLALQNALTKLSRNANIQPKESDVEVDIGPFNFTVGDTNKVVFDTMNVTSSMAVSIGSIYVFKNFTVGAAILSSMQKVSISEEAREAGLPIEERIRAGNISMATEFIVEYAGGRIFAQGLRGKKTVLRTVLRTAEQDAEEIVQLLGDEAVANWYGIRKTTREELVQRILYTAAISTMGGGGISAATTIAENKGILGDMRELGLSDKQIFAVVDGIQTGNTDAAVEAYLVLIQREAEKAGIDLDPRVAEGYAFLLGKTENIHPKLLPTIQEFADGFEAAEFGSNADKLQTKAMELEKIIVERQIDKLRKAGNEKAAKALEEGRLAHLNDALEASGPSEGKSITLGAVETITTNEAVKQLSELISGTDKPTLLGKKGDQKRKRTKSGHLKSVQEAGGPKAAQKILDKFLSGKKLGKVQQVKFDAMFDEFLLMTRQRINDKGEQADLSALEEAQQEAQNLEEQIANVNGIDAKALLQKRLDVVEKKIEELEGREKGKEERDENQKKRETLLQEAEEGAGKLSALQDQAVRAAKGKKVRKVGKKILTNSDAIKALKLKLTPAENLELFGTETPTDVQVADFINQSIKAEKGLKKEAKSTINKLRKQISKGLNEDIKAAKKEARLTLEDFIANEAQRKKDMSGLQRALDRGVQLLESIPLTAEELFTPISSRLGRLNPDFKRRMREFDFRLQNNINDDAAKVADYLKGVNKLDVETRIALDLALKNGEFGVVEAINEANGLTEAFDKVQKMLDNIYERAEAVGLDVRYLENFWPRLVRDPLGMIEYFKGDKALWDQIGFVLQGGNVQFEQMTAEEQAFAINSLIRGFKNPKIATGIPGQLKKRIIDKINAKINTFYYDSDFAIVTYIQRINEAIETNKFFGKGSKKVPFLNIEDSIGHFIIEEVANKNLSPTQAIELESIIRARFNPAQMGAAVGAFKDIGYITVLGNIDNAMTQIGDLYLSMYKAGFFRTMGAFGRSLGTGLSGIITKDRRFVELTREDLGIKQLVAEFNLDQPRLFQGAVKKIFDLSGLAFVDNLGKETAINSILSKYRKLSKAKKIEPAFMEILNNTFGEGNAQAVLVDLQEGLITDDVKFLLFNEIAEAQPITISELPQKYLETGNGKIFYALKTFNIKLFDFVRTQAFDDMANGWKQNDFGLFARGQGRLLRLIFAYVTTNATADLIKDIIYGRPIDLKDTLMDNILETIYFNRYSKYRAQTEGIGRSTIEKLLPPTSIIDNLGKDIYFHAKYGDALTFGEELKFFESFQNIPFAGDPYYWWFGKGKIKAIEKEKKLEKRKEDIKLLKSLPKEKRRLYEDLIAQKKKDEKIKRLRKRLDKLLPKGKTIDSLYDSLK